ncbi:hypothetical protein ACWD6K_32400 [Streptomyces sp. NPDC002431]
MRPVHLLLAAAALLALTACSAEEDVTKPAPEGVAAAERAAGIPAAPTGDARDAYLDAIAAVDPQLVVDEERAIDAGRNQCSSITSPKADALAAQRFGTDARPLTDAQGKRLNAALRATLCP